MTLQNLCLLEKKKNPDFKFLIKPGVTDLELLTKQNSDPIWIKTHVKAFGNIPDIKHKFTPKEVLVPKLRQSESARIKRKAITPPRWPTKSTRGTLPLTKLSKTFKTSMKYQRRQSKYQRRPWKWTWRLS